MKARVSICLLLSIALLVPTATVARADEGMWVFTNVPRETIKERYGFEITDAWLKKVQMASVRFNSGGSGSFVSKSGLVMTNHHVASDTLSKISTPEKNYFKTGFYARTPAEEIKALDLELNVLVSIEDVTDRVTKAVTAQDAAKANVERRAAIAGIEKESLAATGLRSDVVTLYRGAQYHLYRYKRYTDVRLVFAPEYEVAFFGGDPDNFNYPRYCLDLAIFRVYENDKPATVEHYLEWSEDGTDAGDLVFVSGNPGSTSRLNTLAHLVSLRDLQYPFLLRMLERRRDLLQAYAAKGEEQERQAHDDLFGALNSIKVVKGASAGLADEALMARKRADEEALKKAVAKDATKAKAYGGAWEQIAKAHAGLKDYYVEHRLVEGSLGFNSSLFSLARTLVRLAEEDKKPNAERLREFTEASRPSLELRLYSPAPIYDEYEKVRLADSLDLLRDELGANHPVVKKALAGKSPEARAAELVAGTKLDEVEARRALAKGGVEAIRNSKDPMIVLAREIDVEARALRKRYEREVEAIEEASYAKIARALYDVEGDSLYPDATFTLRLAFGTVKGYEENGSQIAPYTTFAGMYEKAAAAGNKEPYVLPERWLEHKDDLDLSTPINFVTTSDTIGGNSGSPLINRNAEVVGLNFDRNIHGLVRNFIYDETRARNVAVDSRGMIEALREVYGAGALADELTR